MRYQQPDDFGIPHSNSGVKCGLRFIQGDLKGIRMMFQNCGNTIR